MTNLKTLEELVKEDSNKKTWCRKALKEIIGRLSQIPFEGKLSKGVGYEDDDYQETSPIHIAVGENDLCIMNQIGELEQTDYNLVDNINIYFVNEILKLLPEIIKDWCKTLKESNWQHLKEDLIKDFPFLSKLKE